MNVKKDFANFKADPTEVGLIEKETKLKLPYHRKESQFMDHREYLRFIKSVEAWIRTRKEYKAYIAYLKSEIGLTRCSVFGNIEDEDAPVEMHHGPIFRLFDLVELSLSKLFISGEMVSSYRVAHEVLSDHFSNSVQVVMLSEMAHKAVHPDPKKGGEPLFISHEQAWGDITRYFNKYKDVLNYAHIMRINNYLNRYRIYKGELKGEISDIFDEILTKWNNL